MGASSGAMKQAAAGGMNAFQQAPQGGFTGMNPYQQASAAQASALGGMQQAMNYTPQQVAAERAKAQGYGAERVAGVGPITEQSVVAGQLGTTSLDPYMNKYTEDVIKANEADILRGAEMGINTLDTAASRAGAFGGSRHGIALGEYGKNVAQELARSSAGLRQAGFTQAQQMAQQDIASRMQAALANQGANLQAQTATGQFGMQGQLANQAAANQAAQFGAAAQNQAALANQQAMLQAAMANQSAGLTANQQRIGAAQGLGGLGQQSFGYGQSVQQNLAQQGQQQQVINQALIDAAKGQYGAYQGAPTAGLGIMTQALGVSPHGQTQTRQLGIMDYLTAGASIAGMSDIRLKKNIKKVGELANGLGVYTWEWKDKVKQLVGNFSMTKGVMAQEAMEVAPEAVITAPNGYLAVDYSHPELKGAI